jgi:hypothetical protein
MNVKWDLFKRSGKWYHGGVIDIPDTTHIWDDDVVEVIMTTQKDIKWTGFNWTGAFLVVDIVEDDQTFFKNLYKL